MRELGIWRPANGPVVCEDWKWRGAALAEAATGSCAQQPQGCPWGPWLQPSLSEFSAAAGTGIKAGIGS